MRCESWGVTIYRARPSAGAYTIYDARTTNPLQNTNQFGGVYGDIISANLEPALFSTGGAVTLTESSSQRIAGSITMTLEGNNELPPGQALSATATMTFSMDLEISGLVTQDKIDELGLNPNGD